MTQLILDAGGESLVLPESRKNGYACLPTPLWTDAEMASGRLTRELRGMVYTLSYQYGLLTGEEKERFLRACEKGWREPIVCEFLTPGVDALERGEFLVTEFSFPRYMWEADGAALWGDFRVILREVTPHA